MIDGISLLAHNYTVRLLSKGLIKLEPVLSQLRLVSCNHAFNIVQNKG